MPTSIAVPEKFQEDYIDHLSLLRLEKLSSSTTVTGSTSHFTTTTASDAVLQSPSNKRHHTTEPQDQTCRQPKKLFASREQNGIATDPLFLGSSDSSGNHVPTAGLRRSTSVPCEEFAACSNGVALSCPECCKKVEAENVKATIPPFSAARPPLPPLLRRTVSDPLSKELFSGLSNGKGDGKNANTKQENFKSLKMMKDCMKEMNKWWEDILPETSTCSDKGEEEEETTVIENAINPTKVDEVTGMEESVTVDRNGDCLIIQLRCPCSKGYQILFSGSNFYYKLV